MKTLALLIATTMLLNLGCKKPEATADGGTSAVADAAAMADADIGLGSLKGTGIGMSEPTFPPEPEPLSLAPAAKSASKEEREKVLLALMSGELESARLPLRATDDPKREIRLGLRDELAPERLAFGPVGVRIAKVEAKGGLTTAIANRVVRQSFGPLRLCYDREKGATDPAGKVTLQLEVEPDGHVSQVSTKETTIARRGLTTCLESALRRASFAASEDKKPTTVTVQLDLGTPPKGP